MPTRRSAIGLSVAVVILLAVGEGSAWAKLEAVQAVPCGGDVVELVIEGEQSTCELLVHRSYFASMHFSSPVTATYVDDDEAFWVRRQRDAVALLVSKDSAPTNATALVKVETENYRARLRIRVTDYPAEAARSVFIRHARELDERSRLALEQRRAERVIESVDVKITTRAQDGELAVLGTEQVWLGPETSYVVFELYNGKSTPVEMAFVGLFDPERKIDHAAFVRIRSPARAAAGHLAVILARTRVKGSALLRDPTSITAPLSLVMHAWQRGPGGELHALRPLVAATNNFELIPLRPPDKQKNRVSLHLTGMLGGIWLEDGIGLDELDPTTVKGLGVRASYSFNRWIAVEGELLGASTGDARFVDVTYNGMQGELVRDATLGRLQFGGALRLGEKIVPTLRLGLGVQGTSHGAEFTPDGGQPVEPDIGFELEGLMSLATRVDFRLGEHLVVGAGLSAIFISGAEQVQSIEAGLELGYAWTP